MTKAKAFLIVIGIIFFVFILKILGIVTWWTGEAVDVAKKEFNPEASLKKYEWFIDQANRIKKGQADVLNQENKEKNIDASYISTYGKERSKWPLIATSQYNTEKANARNDYAAFVSNTNNLIREYNSQSEKFNWSLYNTRSDLPPQKFEEVKGN